MPSKPLTVLLIEDNPDHAELIRRSFQDHQITNSIYHISDGETALDYLFQRGEYASHLENPRPHVILLDLRLPKIDGLEILGEIKADEQLRRIPVIILTTSKAERDLTKAYENYANSYLVKPVDFAKFVHLMKELGFYWLDSNCQPKLQADIRES